MSPLDINDRMPRSEAAEIFCKIRQIGEAPPPLHTLRELISE